MCSQSKIFLIFSIISIFHCVCVFVCVCWTHTHNFILGLIMVWMARVTVVLLHLLLHWEVLGWYPGPIAVCSEDCASFWNNCWGVCLRLIWGDVILSWIWLTFLKTENGAWYSFHPTDERCFHVEIHIFSFKVMFLTLFLNVPLWFLESCLVFNLYILYAVITVILLLAMRASLHGVWLTQHWYKGCECTWNLRLPSTDEKGGLQVSLLPWLLKVRGTKRNLRGFCLLSCTPNTSTIKGLKHTLLGNELNYTENIYKTDEVARRQCKTTLCYAWNMSIHIN